MAFVTAPNSSFFVLTSTRHPTVCPHRRSRFTTSRHATTVHCKARTPPDPLDLQDDADDIIDPPLPSSKASRKVPPSTSDDSLTPQQSPPVEDSTPSDVDPFDVDDPSALQEAQLVIDDSSTSSQINGDSDDLATDDEDLGPCLGELIHSEALYEYNERRGQKGDLKSPKSYESEWIDTWALAVSDSKGVEMQRQYARFGILIEENFDDFEPAEGCSDAFKNADIEETAVIKARAVYEGTGGLPCISEMCEMSIDPPESGSRINKSLQQGYYTKRIAKEGDVMIEKVKPISEDTRMVRFRSVAVYYDGENEVMTEKRLNVAMVFADAGKRIIASTGALDDMFKELSRKFGLTFSSEAVGDHGKVLGWGSGLSSEDIKKGKMLIGGTLLRERIMREGKVLGDGIIKVSSFLNHMVDTDLMEECGKELAERLRRTMPNKVLTVESTGLIIGLPTARELGVPLVFARKNRPITISDSYQTTYRSATKGTTSELIVSCEYLESGDRVLIVDDFLAGGSTAEGLFKLARMAHAKVVGVGVLIEKLDDGGRTFLSGYDVPVESLAKVSTDESGTLTVVEEKPWQPAGAKKMDENRLKEQEQLAAEQFYSRVDGTDEDVSGLQVDEEEDEEVDVIRWEDAK